MPSVLLAQSSISETEATIIGLLVVASLVAIVARRVHLPYSVGLVLIGLLIGPIHVFVHVRLTSDVIFLIFLPPLLFDGAIKLLKLAPAVEGTARLGYPAGVVVPLGITVLACTLFYVIPRTSVLGAILLTGYLGGATATQVRLGDPWFLFPVVLGILVWGGLFLRDGRLRALIPLRT